MKRKLCLEKITMKVPMISIKSPLFFLAYETGNDIETQTKLRAYFQFSVKRKSIWLNSKIKQRNNIQQLTNPIDGWMDGQKVDYTFISTYVRYLLEDKAKKSTWTVSGPFCLRDTYTRHKVLFSQIIRYFFYNFLTLRHLLFA